MTFQHTVIETRMSRPGTTHKPCLQSTVDHIADFDTLGSDMPRSDAWNSHTASWGLNSQSHINVVESESVFCGPRLCYMLRSTGFHYAQSEALTLENSDEAVFNGFIGCDEVQEAINANHALIDVRGYLRYSGEEADPRPNVRSGHIPGSLNLHYARLISETNPLKLKSLPELKALFAQHKIDLQSPLVFSCGSGVTACIGALAAIACGAKHCVVYDGSWAEWGSRGDLPVATLV